MLETPHAIVGAAIAAKITNPLIGIPLAFGSHFILDMVPHWNPHINTELKNGGIKRNSKLIIFSDVLVSLASGFAIANSVSNNYIYFTYIIAACFAAVLPDVVEAPYFFLGWKHSILGKWLKFQKHIQVDTTPFIGMAVQIVTILTALWWIYS